VLAAAVRQELAEPERRTEERSHPELLTLKKLQASIRIRYELAEPRPIDLASAGEMSTDHQPIRITGAYTGL
jgi:hypothetical protein